MTQLLTNLLASQALPAARAIILLRATREAIDELSTQAHLYSSMST